VAQAGLKSIDNAIQDILAAIFDNEPAPADSREQLADGAKAVKIGLDSITE
jgi:aryl carrier-like protein